MRTVNTWASPGINDDRTSCTTFIVDFDSESVVSRDIRFPIMVAKRTHPTPRRRTRLVRRLSRTGTWKLPVVQADQGWRVWDQLSFPQFHSTRRPECASIQSE